MVACPLLGSASSPPFLLRPYRPASVSSIPVLPWLSRPYKVLLRAMLGLPLAPVLPALSLHHPGLKKVLLQETCFQRTHSSYPSPPSLSLGAL